MGSDGKLTYVRTKRTYVRPYDRTYVRCVFTYVSTYVRTEKTR